HSRSLGGRFTDLSLLSRLPPCPTRFPYTTLFRSDHRRIEPVATRGQPPEAVARMILAGFARHYSLFRYSAQRAKALFESGDWHGIQHLSRERFEYYDTRERECATALGPALRGTARAHSAPDTALTDEQVEFWQAVKSSYIALMAGHRQPERAETF